MARLAQLLGDTGQHVEVRSASPRFPATTLAMNRFMPTVHDLVAVPRPRGHLDQLGAEREALLDRVGSDEGVGAGVERVGERGVVSARRASSTASSLSRVATLARGLVAQRSREAGEQPDPELDVVVGERREPLLEQRHEPIVAPGALEQVSGRRSRPLRGRARAAARGGARCPPPPGTPSSLPDRSPRALAPRRARGAARSASSSVGSGQLERVERRLVQPRGLLVGEERRARDRRRAARRRSPWSKSLPGDRVVRELGEVRARLVAVERLERLDRQPVQPNATRGRRARRRACRG